MGAFTVVILVVCLSACHAEESVTVQTDVLSHVDSEQVLISAFTSNSSNIAPKRQKDFRQAGCATVKPAVVSPGVLAVDATHGAPMSAGFCRVIAKKSLTSRNYEISVDLYNVYGLSNRDPNYGHPGVFFNAMDTNTYDSVYFRCHSTGPGCQQIGQFINGALFESYTTDYRTCFNGPVRGQTWFNMKVVVNDGRALIYRDNVLVSSVLPRIPTRASGGVLVRTGFQNIVHFRNFKITSLD